ncbi:MAG: hypothetical protein JWO82_4419 [Akkermansiaceae bacterium]|nr:hypothetical protein [Akkermansiaceae bacterium]
MALFRPPVEVQHYPVEPGLFAGEYPGSIHREVALERIRGLVAEGVTTFIDLTTEADAARGLSPYREHLPPIAPDGTQIIHHRFPIPDMSVPEGPQTMQSVLQLIESEMAAGRTCYVHCWGGIGRTGTAVACWLMERGATADEALARVQLLYDTHMSPAKRARFPHSPQDPSQHAYVRAWERPPQRQAATPSQPAE